MSYVLVKEGSYRNQTVKNTVFPLVQDLKAGKNGMFVTVDGSKDFGSNKIRVKVSSTEQLEYMGDSNSLSLSQQLSQRLMKNVCLK